MLKDYQITLLELLEKLEVEISKLYDLFAVKFPAYRDLWIHLRDEEIKHANYINQLNVHAREGRVLFDEKLTKTFTIKAVMDDIKDKYKKTEQDQYSLINALAFSVSLEQSIIEHKFYNYFNSDNPEIMKMIDDIRQDTASHESKIKGALDQEKRS